ncbi:hypothetical protein HDU76_013414 [Blyttiomyces sp. JEL0837]|nr:hypothetical protein HDU76_013414 [Blyttiomyces sp. JEL0837]
MAPPSRSKAEFSNSMPMQTMLKPSMKNTVDNLDLEAANSNGKANNKSKQANYFSSTSTSNATTTRPSSESLTQSEPTNASPFGVKNPKIKATLSKASKYLCCCIPKSKTARWICLSVTTLVLIMIAIAGYFLWPKYPEVHVLHADIVGKFNFSSSNPAEPKNLNYITMSLRLRLNVSAINNNLYDLNIKKLDFDGFMFCNMSDIARYELPAAFTKVVKAIGPYPPANNIPSGYKPNTEPKIGSGTYDTLILPSKQNTTFTMDFVFVYSPDPVVGFLRDPFLAEIFRSCGITGPERPTKIDYNVVPTLNGLGKSNGLFGLGGIQNSILINCLANQTQIKALEDAPDGVDGFTLLEQIFGLINLNPRDGLKDSIPFHINWTPPRTDVGVVTMNAVIATGSKFSAWTVVPSKQISSTGGDTVPTPGTTN